MSNYTVDGTEVLVYRVGVLRDVYEWRKNRHRRFWYWFKTSWRRRSYWNGYLAESKNKPYCGRGWTERQALRAWKRIPEL